MERIDIGSQRARIENINALPTLPGTFKRISQVIGKPGVSLDEIGRFVASDPALTAKVLKMVNSAVYGFPGRISSVSHAIMLLGLNVVKGLLLGVSVAEVMQQVMGGLWEHSLGCAVAARAIAERKGVKDPEEVSVAALLHDLGKVILLLHYPTPYGAALAAAAERRIPIAEAEAETFGQTHATVGLWLAERWHFPPGLVEAIGHHHRPVLAKHAPLETAIVHFADVLVRARGIGFAGDDLAAAVQPAAFERLALGEREIGDVLDILEHARDDAGELVL